MRKNKESAIAKQALSNASAGTGGPGSGMGGPGSSSSSTYKSNTHTSNLSLIPSVGTGAEVLKSRSPGAGVGGLKGTKSVSPTRNASSNVDDKGSPVRVKVDHSGGGPEVRSPSGMSRSLLDDDSNADINARYVI